MTRNEVAQLALDVCLIGSFTHREVLMKDRFIGVKLDGLTKLVNAAYPIAILEQIQLALATPGTDLASLQAVVNEAIIDHYIAKEDHENHR